MSAPGASTDEYDNDQASSPGRRRGLVLAGAFLVVLLAVGLLLALVPSGDREPVVGGESASPTTAAAPSQAPVAAEACELPAGDQTVPVVPPADTQWELVGRVVAPTAPEVYGPAVTDPVRSCFARNPTGALYAAVNALATTTLPDAPRLLAEDLGAEGPGRDAALSQLPADGTPVPNEADAQIQLAGFQFLSYTEDETVIDLAIQTVTDTGNATVHAPFTLRWERDDWRVVHTAEGAPFGTLQVVPSLAGYVPWSGT